MSALFGRKQSVEQEPPEAREEKLRAAVQALAEALAPRATQTPSFDPRLVYFECLSGLSLRPGQVEIVARYLSRVGSKQNTVSQLLMGEGKTTVVLPLLALLISSTGLCITVVPRALLRFTVETFRT